MCSGGLDAQNVLSKDYSMELRCRDTFARVQSRVLGSKWNRLISRPTDSNPIIDLNELGEVNDIRDLIGQPNRLISPINGLRNQRSIRDEKGGSRELATGLDPNETNPGVDTKRSREGDRKITDVFIHYKVREETTKDRIDRKGYQALIGRSIQ